MRKLDAVDGLERLPVIGRSDCLHLPGTAPEQEANNAVYEPDHRSYPSLMTSPTTTDAKASAIARNRGSAMGS